LPVPPEDEDKFSLRKVVVFCSEEMGNVQNFGHVNNRIPSTECFKTEQLKSLVLTHVIKKYGTQNVKKFSAYLLSFVQHSLITYILRLAEKPVGLSMILLHSAESHTPYVASQHVWLIQRHYVTYDASMVGHHTTYSADTEALNHPLSSYKLFSHRIINNPHTYIDIIGCQAINAVDIVSLKNL
jgi:hypothetical protein